jgi:hypothetical protein
MALKRSHPPIIGAMHTQPKVPGGFKAAVDLYQCECGYAQNKQASRMLLAMPLDPTKIRRKGSATRQAVLLAVEWSAIIFSGMLAVLFLSWALELRLLQINISDTTESAHIGAPL